MLYRYFGENFIIILSFKLNNSSIWDFKDCSRFFNGLKGFVKYNMSLIMIKIRHEFFITTLS